MGSILIISNSSKIYTNYIINYITNEEDIELQNLLNIDIISNKRGDKKISTSQIREYIKQATTKPTVLKNKYLVLYNFNRATPNAQNAFLKTLEESNVNIILQASSKADILETVISRAKIVELKNVIKVSKEIQNLLAEIIENQKLSKIPALVKNTTSIQIIRNLEIYIKGNIRKNPKRAKSAAKKLYLYKKRVGEVPLNTELQVTNIVLDLIE
jgi:DNA polymerase III delta prime subunit